VKTLTFIDGSTVEVPANVPKGPATWEWLVRNHTAPHPTRFQIPAYTNTKVRRSASQYKQVVARATASHMRAVVADLRMLEDVRDRTRDLIRRAREAEDSYLDATQPAPRLQTTNEDAIWRGLLSLADELRFTVELDSLGRNSLVGLCDFNYNIITIRDGLTKRKANEALCHELAHALMHGMSSSTTAETKEVECEVVLRKVFGKRTTFNLDHDRADVHMGTDGRAARAARRIIRAINRTHDGRH
jgi:hypothetical protein